MSNPSVLEVTARPQTDVMLDSTLWSGDFSYPIDPRERLRFLADNYHALPLEMAIEDTLWASAQRADQWVATKNETSGSNSHVSGHAAAIKRALGALGTSDDAWARNPRVVKDSIRNLANGKDSFGEEMMDSQTVFFRAIRFHEDLKEAELSEGVHRAFKEIFQSESARKYLVEQLEEHWVGQPTEAVPIHALSSKRLSRNPEGSIEGYWQGRAVNFTKAGVGLFPAHRVQEDSLDRAFVALGIDARQRDIKLSADNALQLIAYMQVVVNLRTSERAANETAKSFRIPVMSAFADLDVTKVRNALHDLVLHNPKLFPARALRTLGISYEDIAAFESMKTEEAETLMVEKMAVLTAQAEAREQFLRDCEDPEVVRDAHASLIGQVIVARGVEKKYGGGSLRYIQPGLLAGTKRDQDPSEILVIRRLLPGQDGVYEVDMDGHASVTTTSVLRRIMDGEIEILDDVQVKVPESLQRAANRFLRHRAAV